MLCARVHSRFVNLGSHLTLRFFLPVGLMLLVAASWFIVSIPDARNGSACACAQELAIDLSNLSIHLSVLSVLLVHRQRDPMDV